MRTDRLIIGVLALVVLGGTVAAGGILWKGHSLLGSSDVVQWNIFVPMYAYLAGIATGLAMISCLGPVFGLKRYQPLAVVGLFVSIFTMLAAFASIMLDLGRPWMAFGFLFYPNPSSPIWWMAMLYGVFLACVVLTLSALVSGRDHLARIGGVLTLVFALAASGNLGLVFGSVYTRDLWYGPFTPFTFVMVAWILGTAALFLLQNVREETFGRMSGSTVGELRYILVGLLVMRLIYTATKVLMGFYVAKGDMLILISGSFWVNFWIGEVFIGIVLPLALFWVTARGNQLTVIDRIGAGMVLVGFFMARYNLVIAGQMYPLVEGHAKGSYIPTLAEIVVMAGLTAFILLALRVGRSLALPRFQDRIASMSSPGGKP